MQNPLFTNVEANRVKQGLNRLRGNCTLNRCHQLTLCSWQRRKGLSRRTPRNRATKQANAPATMRSNTIGRKARIAIPFQTRFIGNENTCRGFGSLKDPEGMRAFSRPPSGLFRGLCMTSLPTTTQCKQDRAGSSETATEVHQSPAVLGGRPPHRGGVVSPSPTSNDASSRGHGICIGSYFYGALRSTRHLNICRCGALCDIRAVLGSCRKCAIKQSPTLATQVLAQARGLVWRRGNTVPSLRGLLLPSTGGGGHPTLQGGLIPPGSHRRHLGHQGASKWAARGPSRCSFSASSNDARATTSCVGAYTMSQRSRADSPRRPASRSPTPHSPLTVSSTPPAPGDVTSLAPVGDEAVCPVCLDPSEQEREKQHHCAKQHMHVLLRSQNPSPRSSGLLPSLRVPPVLLHSGLRLGQSSLPPKHPSP